METFYDLHILTDLHHRMLRDVTILLTDIENYSKVSAQDNIAKYTRFAANMHRAKLFDNIVYSIGGGESHLIHWMANLRQGSSTTSALRQQLHGFIFSITDVTFMKLFCNVGAWDPSVYLMECKENILKEKMFY